MTIMGRAAIARKQVVLDTLRLFMVMSSLTRHRCTARSCLPFAGLACYRLSQVDFDVNDANESFCYRSMDSKGRI
jgi:hypothetical protein